MMRHLTGAEKRLIRICSDRWRWLVLIPILSGLIALFEWLNLTVTFGTLQLLTTDSWHTPAKTASLFNFIYSLTSPMSSTQDRQNITLLVFLVVLVIAQLCLQTTRYVLSVSNEHFSGRIKEAIISALHALILSAPYSLSLNLTIGNVSTVLIEVPQAFCQAVLEFLSLSNSIVVGLVYVFFLIRLSPFMVILVLVMMISSGLLMRRLLPRSHDFSTGIVETTARIGSYVADDLRSFKLIKVTNLYDQSVKRLQKSTTLLRKLISRSSFYNQAAQPASQFIGTIVVVVVILSGSFLLTSDGGSPIAPIAIFVISLQRLTGILASISSSLTGISQSRGKISLVDSVFSALDAHSMNLIKPSIAIHPVPLRTPLDTSRQLLQSIELRNVSFSYNQQSPPSVSNVSLTALRGESIALVGRSGSGKSTTLDLMMGLLTPQSGHIFINSKIASSSEFQSLSDDIGYVGQDPYTFQGTILDNITVGRDIRSSRTLAKALIRSQSRGFIASLEDGVSTIIGEGNRQLSGGQRQRINIARALYRNPVLLVLDEATSSLDPLTELNLANSLIKDAHNRITVAVAHRLSFVMHYDKIYVFENGSIVEHGNHETLIHNRSLYYDLWESQA